METKNIQEFLALAKLGSSYSAAEKLFISQSSLVRHIQSMEEEFGVPLFDRTRRGFALNANGRIFQPYAEKIAMLQSQCYQALHPEEKDPGVIRIAAEGKIIDLMIDFKKEFPNYNLDDNFPYFGTNFAAYGPAATSLCDLGPGFLRRLPSLL